MPKAFERDKQAQDIAAEAGRKTSAEFEVPEDPVVLWTSESERDTQAIQDIADEAERKIEEARGNGFEANEDPVALWTSETYNVVGERETGVAPEVERKTDEGEGYGGGNVDGDGEEDQRRPLSRRSTPENHTHDIAAVSTFLDHFPTEGKSKSKSKSISLYYRHLILRDLVQ